MVDFVWTFDNWFCLYSAATICSNDRVEAGRLGHLEVGEGDGPAASGVGAGQQ